MHKQGFTIIELLVATFMASIVSVALFTAFSQSLTVQKAVDDFFYVSMHKHILHNQLSVDLMGAFVPVQAQSKSQKSSNQQTANNKPKPSNTQTTSQETSRKKNEKPLEKVFFGTEKNNMFELLTCITRNPLTIYWSDSSGYPKAKRARIIYRLEAEKEHPNSYTLIRQEGAELVFKKYEKKEAKMRTHVILHGIKSIRVTYVVGKREKAEKQGAKQQKKEEKIVYTTMQNWNSDDEKQRQETKTLLPDFVQINAELWNKDYTKSSSIKVTIPLISVKQKEQPEQSKQTETQQTNPAPIQEKEQTKNVAYVGTIDLKYLDNLPQSSPGVINWQKLFG